MDSLPFCSREAAGRLLLPLLCSVWLLVSCEKDDSPTEQPHQRPGLITAVGSPRGNAVTATIGPEGGTLVSEDGLLTISVPPDALSQPTTLSVQGISAEAPLAVGGAYRLLPHGQQFGKAVSLSFTYAEEELSSKTGQALGIAFQDDEGVWQAMPGVSIQAAAQKATLTTTHFSDWSLYESYQLVPGEAHLDVSESVSLEVVHLGDLITPLVPTPLPEPAILQDNQVGPWLLNGNVALPTQGPDGSLIELGARATYTAPASLPDRNPVAVSAEVDVPGKSKLILVSSITIGGTYLTINGGPFSNVTFRTEYPGYAVYENGHTMVHFIGTTEDAQEELMQVSLILQGSGEGTYTWSAEKSCGITLYYLMGNSEGVSANHMLPDEPPRSHSGTIIIEKYGAVGEGVIGTFSGTVTIYDLRCTVPCVSTGSVTGAFQVPRAH